MRGRKLEEVFQLDADVKAGDTLVAQKLRLELTTERVERRHLRDRVPNLVEADEARIRAHKQHRERQRPLELAAPDLGNELLLRRVHGAAASLACAGG